MRLVGDFTGLGTLSGGYYLAGVVLSHVFFFVALVLLYALSVHALGSTTYATRTVWLMCSLPWANTFSMTYTESLFLMLALASMLVAYRGATSRPEPVTIWLVVSSLLAALATLTRPQGFIVAASVAWFLAVGPIGLSVARRLLIALLALVPSFFAAAGFVIYVAAHTQSSNLLAIEQTTTACLQCARSFDQ